MRTFLAELYRRNKVLALTGWVHLALFVIVLAIAPFDARTVLGINPWIKPMKFMLSITIYVWTIAWFLEYVRESQWACKLIAWGTAIALFTEITSIVMQSARGTTSHFNVTSSVDGIIFGIMGLMIAISTMLEVLLLVLFFRRKVALPSPYLWGIRFGMMIFFVGSGIGGQMVRNMAHTVGVADGGPGLPIVNWSTIAGDLRVAHALGLHALQLLPLMGFLLSRSTLTVSVQRNVVLAVSLICAIAVVALYIQAMDGVPFVAGW